MAVPCSRDDECLDRWHCAWRRLSLPIHLLCHTNNIANPVWILKAWAKYLGHV